ncbi:MAG: hypothetical protein KC501_11750 [Myxococcales bacterium]|nr:hypothetical protein [Myxococcales bacterium]
MAWALGCALGEGTPYDTDNPGLGSGGDGSAGGDETSSPIDSAEGGNPVCGNGQVEAGEACDDGNDDDTDACTIACRAPACDDGLRSGQESDVDCGGSCVPCSQGDGCDEHGDCETGFCVEGRCGYPASCRERLEADPDAVDGVYEIDPDGEGGIEPFGVSCDMTISGGGWIRLSLQNSDGVVVGQNAADNPWIKCEDDAAQHFGWIDEGTISADLSPGATFDEEVALSYQNPTDGTVYTVAQVEALRPLVSELHPGTRMVAVTADDDGADWATDMSGGHELYLRNADGELTLLTPGTNGDCGGGAGSWPAAGSQSAFYLWGSDPESSAVDGNTGLSDADLGGLAPGDLLPSAVRLVVQTGGGVAFGWEQVVFLVR